MAPTDDQVEVRLAELQVIFQYGGYAEFEFSDRDRAYLRDYLGNNDVRTHDEYRMNPNASPVARAAVAFDLESRRPVGDPNAPANLAEAHRQLFQHVDPHAGQLSGQELPWRASAVGEILRNLSDTKMFAKAAGEYYALVGEAAPHGRGSRVAAQLFIDRQARAAGHSVDWQQFHRRRNATLGPLLTADRVAQQTHRNERAFSDAISPRQVQRAKRRSSQPASLGAETRRLGLSGPLRRADGLARDTRGAQWTR